MKEFLEIILDKNISDSYLMNRSRFDHDHDNFVNYNEFLIWVRYEMQKDAIYNDMINKCTYMFY